MAFFVGREVYRHLERVLDAFEDVADEIQGIVIDQRLMDGYTYIIIALIASRSRSIS